MSKLPMTVIRVFFQIVLSVLLIITQTAKANSNSKQETDTANLPFFITVEPNTILPSEVAIGFTVHAKYQIKNPNFITAVNASIVSLPKHTTIDPSGCGPTFTLAPNASCTLTLQISADGLRVGDIISGAINPNVLMACWNDGVSCAGVTNQADLLHVEVIPPPSLPYQSLLEDVLINADLWGDTPEILSANYGFEGIEGVPGNEAGVIAAG